MLRDLTVAFLVERAARLPDWIPASQRDYALAAEIIIKALGQPFWVREIATSTPRHEMFSGRRRLFHVVRLADIIWKLRETPGFEALLVKNGNQSFESTFFELSAAELIAEQAQRIEFVVPTGVKGQDFDMRAIGYFEPDDAAIEFKFRRSPFKSDSMLRNFLNDARSQLPKSGNGVLHCHLHPVGNIDAEHMVDVIAKWLHTSTSRVKRVVLHWSFYREESLSAYGLQPLPYGEEGVISVDRARLMIGPSGRVLERGERPQQHGVHFMADIGLPCASVNPYLSTLPNLRCLGMRIQLGTWSNRDNKWWQAS